MVALFSLVPLAGWCRPAHGTREAAHARHTTCEACRAAILCGVWGIGSGCLPCAAAQRRPLGTILFRLLSCPTGCMHAAASCTMYAMRCLASGLLAVPPECKEPQRVVLPVCGGAAVMGCSWLRSTNQQPQSGKKKAWYMCKGLGVAMLAAAPLFPTPHARPPAQAVPGLLHPCYRPRPWPPGPLRQGTSTPAMC